MFKAIQTEFKENKFQTIENIQRYITFEKEKTPDMSNIFISPLCLGHFMDFWIEEGASKRAMVALSKGYR